MKRAPWRHFAADLACSATAVLSDPDGLAALIRRSLLPGSEPCTFLWHRFEPHGVSVLALASTMRVALHTWPERRRLTIDVWTIDAAISSRLTIIGDQLSGGRESD